MHLFIAFVLSTFLLLVSCDLEPSPSFGGNAKCPKRELTEIIGEPSNGNHGFKIKISGNPDKYVPGQMYTSTYNLGSFSGALKQRICARQSDEDGGKLANACCLGRGCANWTICTPENVPSQSALVRCLTSDV